MAEAKTCFRCSGIMDDSEAHIVSIRPLLDTKPELFWICEGCKKQLLDGAPPESQILIKKLTPVEEKSL